MFGGPGPVWQAVRNIPEKFLVTSKVVKMAPCSDRKEGKKEGMMMEVRKKEIERGRLVIAGEKSTAKGQLEGFREQVIIFLS